MTSAEYQEYTLLMIPKDLAHSLQDNKFLTTNNQLRNITNSPDEFIKNPEQLACLWMDNYFWRQDDKNYVALTCINFYREEPFGNFFEPFENHYSSGNVKKPTLLGVFLLSLVYSMIL
ncbi:hypothetical protein K7432_008137 [Basidiobolus ranarum]|uniref:Uncharacterized protein n=1 Tax=Basidiobolus ranarum TaxID=34480 RepID=A0ABR2WSA5_9FUNG